MIFALVCLIATTWFYWSSQPFVCVIGAAPDVQSGFSFTLKGAV